MINKMKILPLTSLGNLESYIRLANSFPMLSIEEEKLLTERLYYNGDLESAKTLILFHLRFVIHIARNYTGYGLPQSDLIQEGNIGLMKAIRRFNPAVGVRLVSFAVHWIKSEIHEYVLRNWRIVKIATTKSQRKLFFNLRKNKQRLGWFNTDELEIIAKNLGVHSEDVREMEYRMSVQDVSFNLSSNKDNHEKKSNIIFSCLRDYSSNFSLGVEEDNWKVHATNKLTNALLILDERSRHIIHARWLNKKNKITLQEIANNYGISAERVRQLEKNAMQKLKIAIEA